MDNKFRKYLLNISLLLIIINCSKKPANTDRLTYCNPVNIDYAYSPHKYLKYHFRTAADPVLVNYKNEYYLFATNQKGYWVSNNLANWKFIEQSFQTDTTNTDDLCAPAVFVLGDTMIVKGSFYSDSYTWMSTDPKNAKWKPLDTVTPYISWDPSFFADDDGKVFLYHGSSNSLPLWGTEVNRKTLNPISSYKFKELTKPTGESIKSLIKLHPKEHGWERFGENNDDYTLDPFIEGAWMDKHNGKYYLQYGAPGSEFKGYAEGVYVSDNPLSGFEYQKHNPFSYKAGGFIRGAGHGSTFKDSYQNYWHIGTMVISVKYKFERRIGLFPTYFDQDGIMYSNTAWGDYPHYIPQQKSEENTFTGWMLLSYKKQAWASSSLKGKPNIDIADYATADPLLVAVKEKGFAIENAFDENIKTYWSAKNANKGEWLKVDLGSKNKVYAIQTNFADQDATARGKQIGLSHKYKIWGSHNDKDWFILLDKSNENKETPNDYVMLDKPIDTRFIKLENINIPNGKFAVSGLRVFGKGYGKIPKKIENLKIIRNKEDSTKALLSWDKDNKATGYNIYYGIAPNKLYTSIMVYDNPKYDLRTLNKGTDYYFSVESFNENGVSERSEIKKI